MSRSSRSPRWRAGLAALALLAAPAGATTLFRLTDEQLIDRSALIVTGSCTGVRTEWRQGMLVTLATVRIHRTLKGEAASEVTVAIPGGVDLDREVPVAVNVPGAPSIRPNERVLLFLEPVDTGGGELAVTGFSQGKLSILEAADGTPVVYRNLAGVALATGQGLRPGGRRSEPLSVLAEKIVRRAWAIHDVSRIDEEEKP